MNRFFVLPEDVGTDKIFITDKDDIHHISRVLRLKVNEKVEISDGVKSEYLAEISEISGDFVVCKVLEELSFSREPDVNITLFQGLPKQGKMELIIQKAVELGASAVTPCVFKRSINSDLSKADKKIERWQKIAAEAAGQSKRKVIPKVHSCMDLKNLLKEFEKFDLIVVAYEDERKTYLKDILEKLDAVPQKVALIIGPEGGFEASEVESMVLNGAASASLGKTILRTETAGLCALSMLMYELEM